MVTLPVGIPSLMLAMAYLPDSRDGQRRSLDAWGLLAMIGFLVPLLLALNRGPREGWDATFTLVCFAIAAPVLLAFVALALIHKEPFVDLRLLQIFPFSMASVVRFLHSTGLHTYAFLMALFVQQTLGYTPHQAGLMMLPGAAVMGVAGLLVGRLADKLEPRAILVVGLTSLALVGYAFSFVTPLTTVAWLVLLLIWLRMSTECLFSPLNVAALGTAGTASLLGRWQRYYFLAATKAMPCPWTGAPSSAALKTRGAAPAKWKRRSRPTWRRHCRHICWRAPPSRPFRICFWWLLCSIS